VNLSGATLSAGGSNPGMASNYTLVGPSLGSVTITPAAITVSASDTVKTYDATTSVSGATTAPTPTLVSGTLYTNGGIQDSLAGGSYAYTDPNAGSGNKTVTVGGVTIANSVTGNTVATANYTITYVNNTTSTINPASLYVSGISANNKTYNATNAATISGTPTISGSTFGQSVTLSGAVSSGAFASPGATNGITVTPDLSSLSINNPNFVLVGPTAAVAANITPAPLTISGLTGTNKVYDATTAAVVNGTPTLAGNLFGQTVTVSGAVSSGSFAQSNVGNALTITPNLGGLSLNNSNFYIAGPTAAVAANITPAPLTISGLTGANKVYNGTTSASISGTPNLVGNLFGQSVSFSGVITSGIFAQSNPGRAIPISVALSNLSLNNPNFFISGLNGTLSADITPSNEVPLLTLNQAATVNNLATTTISTGSLSSNGLPIQQISSNKPEPIYIKDMSATSSQNLLVLQPPSSGSLRFPVPDKTFQDLINISGNGFTGSITTGASTGVVKLLLLPNNSSVEATLATGEPLPDGVRFNPSNKTFYIEKLSDVNLPIEVKLTLKNQSQKLSEKVIMITK
jgi:YDG domain